MGAATPMPVSALVATRLVSAIKTFLHRAHKTSSKCDSFNNETQHLQLTLINNGFTNTKIDKQIRLFLNSINTTNGSTYRPTLSTHKIYFT